MLDPTSRITALCRGRGSMIGLLTDARFSGGSVGLVIGHVGPEAAVGGPIALLEDGDPIVVELLARRLDCPTLDEAAVVGVRRRRWQRAADANSGEHPALGTADSSTVTVARTRDERRTRRAIAGRG